MTILTLRFDQMSGARPGLQEMANETFLRADLEMLFAFEMGMARRTKHPDAAQLRINVPMVAELVLLIDKRDRLG